MEEAEEDEDVGAWRDGVVVVVVVVRQEAEDAGEGNDDEAEDTAVDEETVDTVSVVPVAP